MSRDGTAPQQPGNPQANSFSWDNPNVQNTAIGAGIGAGIGLLASQLRKKKKPGDSLRDALLGAAIGGAGGYFGGNSVRDLFQRSPSEADTQDKSHSLVTTRYGLASQADADLLETAPAILPYQADSVTPSTPQEETKATEEETSSPFTFNNLMLTAGSFGLRTPILMFSDLQRQQDVGRTLRGMSGIEGLSDENRVRLFEKELQSAHKSPVLNAQQLAAEKAKIEAKYNASNHNAYFTDLNEIYRDADTSLEEKANKVKQLNKRYRFNAQRNINKQVKSLYATAGDGGVPEEAVTALKDRLGITPEEPLKAKVHGPQVEGEVPTPATAKGLARLRGQAWLRNWAKPIGKGVGSFALTVPLFAAADPDYYPDVEGLDASQTENPNGIARGVYNTGLYGAAGGMAATLAQYPLSWLGHPIAASGAAGAGSLLGAVGAAGGSAALGYSIGLNAQNTAYGADRMNKEVGSQLSRLNAPDSVPAPTGFWNTVGLAHEAYKENTGYTRGVLAYMAQRTGIQPRNSETLPQYRERVTQTATAQRDATLQAVAMGDVDTIQRATGIFRKKDESPEAYKQRVSGMAETQYKKRIGGVRDGLFSSSHDAGSDAMFATMGTQLTSGVERLGRGFRNFARGMAGETPLVDVPYPDGALNNDDTYMPVGHHLYLDSNGVPILNAKGFVQAEDSQGNLHPVSANTLAKYPYRVIGTQVVRDNKGQPLLRDGKPQVIAIRSYDIHADQSGKIVYPRGDKGDQQLEVLNEYVQTAFADKGVLYAPTVEELGAFRAHMAGTYSADQVASRLSYHRPERNIAGNSLSPKALAAFRYSEKALEPAREAGILQEVTPDQFQRLRMTPEQRSHQDTCRELLTNFGEPSADTTEAYTKDAERIQQETVKECEAIALAIQKTASQGRLWGFGVRESVLQAEYTKRIEPVLAEAEQKLQGLQSQFLQQTMGEQVTKLQPEVLRMQSLGYSTQGTMDWYQQWKAYEELRGTPLDEGETAEERNTRLTGEAESLINQFMKLVETGPDERGLKTPEQLRAEMQARAAAYALNKQTTNNTGVWSYLSDVDNNIDGMFAVPVKDIERNPNRVPIGTHASVGNMIAHYEAIGLEPFQNMSNTLKTKFNVNISPASLKAYCELPNVNGSQAWPETKEDARALEQRINFPYVSEKSPISLRLAAACRNTVSSKTINKYMLEHSIAPWQTLSDAEIEQIATELMTGVINSMIPTRKKNVSPYAFTGVPPVLMPATPVLTPDT